METNQLIFWAVVFVISAVAEAVTMQLVSIWFAIGAIAAFISAFFLPFGFQLTVFVAVSLLCLIASRPLIKKLMVKTVIPTNIDREIGCRAIVIEQIDGRTKNGRVRLNGVDWNAYTEDGSVINKDEPVVVKQITGTSVLVEKCFDPENGENELWSRYSSR